MIVDEVPPHAPDALDGCFAGESLDGGAREGFDGSNKVIPHRSDGEGGSRIDNDRDAVR